MFLETVRRFQFGGGIATNEISAIGSGSAKAEAVEAASKPTALETLVVRAATRQTFWSIITHPSERINDW